MDELPVKKSETGCPECGNLQFDLEHADTVSRDMDLYMVKCGHCHTVVGIFDKSISDLLYEVRENLADAER
jgi:ribosomal protein S27AE